MAGSDERERAAEADDEQRAPRQPEVAGAPEDRVRDHPSERVAHHAAEQRQRRHQRNLIELEPAGIRQVRRQPRQEHPQRPSVAEVDDGDEPHAADDLPPRRRSARRARRFAARADLRQLRAVTHGCSSGVSLNDATHTRGPRQARRAEHDERLAPSVSRHDREDDGRRDRAAEPREAVGDALREAPLANRQPEGERARRRRKRPAFADADEHAERRRATRRSTTTRSGSSPTPTAGSAPPSTRRGPNRSDSQPPTICMPAYGYANAEKMSPSWVGVSPSSFRSVGAATEMFTRSM